MQNPANHIQFFFAGRQQNGKSVIYMIVFFIHELRNLFTF